MEGSLRETRLYKHENLYSIISFQDFCVMISTFKYRCVVIMEDGGYYALKGFDFQIDKTIIEIFSTQTDTEQISIERIQDLSSDAFVTQVKYKETQDFAYSKIRDPVVQLINESASDNTERIYILYCHFSDQQEKVRTFDVAGLNELLEIKLHKGCSEAHTKKYNAIQAIPDTLKAAFVARFQLVFAPMHQTQFKRAIQTIEAQDFCQSAAEASFYYCYIADFLRRLVISNDAPEERVCTRKTLENILKDKKRQFFHSALTQFHGRQALLKFLRKQFDRPLPSQSAIIFLGSRPCAETQDLLNAIVLIVEQHLRNATHDVFPITFVVDKENALDLKIGLIIKDITFNDGFETIRFSSSQFNKRHIALRKTNATGRPLDSLGQISYMLRITTRENFKASRAEESPPDRVYYFDADEFEDYSGVPSFQVEGLSCNEIWQFFKR